MTARRTVPLVAVLMAATLLGLLAYGVVARGSNRSLDGTLASGARPVAPGFSLPALGAPGTRSLRALRGRVVVVNFWASWCPACLHETPALQRTQTQLARHGGTVLGITFQDTVGDSLSFLHARGLTYPNAHDVDGRVARSYGTRALPETFVIDRAGRVAAISRGPVDAAFLRRAVALAERT